MKLEVGKYYVSRSGDKVGPTQNHLGIKGYPWDAVGDNGTPYFYTDYGVADDGEEFDLVSEWPERSPIRTRTVTEIVPGVYGRISIHKNTYNDGKVLIRLADGAGGVNLNNCGHYMSRSDLIAARDVFNQLIDAMPSE